MKRRAGLRARTDFTVITRSGLLESRCRGVEVSAAGIVLDRGRLVRPRDLPILLDLELLLPERVRPLRAKARPVWSLGSRQGLRFVAINDADRLTLAEHLDLQSLRGARLS